jgi:hypothetical protein
VQSHFLSSTFCDLRRERAMDVAEKEDTANRMHEKTELQTGE